jgi:hypothetical protein
LLVSTITNFVTDKNIYLDYFCKRSFVGGSKEEFKQAFAASVVLDLFNLFAALIFFPLVGLRQKTNREKPQPQSLLGIYFEKPKIAETQIDQGKS